MSFAALLKNVIQKDKVDLRQELEMCLRLKEWLYQMLGLPLQDLKKALCRSFTERDVKYLVVRICLTKIEDAFTIAKNYCVFFVDIYQ